jgi:tetratricopeptide (TPR) repeat protein
MLYYLRQFYTRVEASGAVNVQNMHRLGFAYAMNGYNDEADYYFNTMIEYYERLILQERANAGTYYDLSGVYAFRGEKDKALTNLRKYNQQEIFPRWWVEMLSNDPLFDSIRDEPEFQQIVRDVKAKY